MTTLNFIHVLLPICYIDEQWISTQIRVLDSPLTDYFSGKLDTVGIKMKVGSTVK